VHIFTDGSSLVNGIDLDRVLKDQSIMGSIFHTICIELLFFNIWLIKSLTEIKTQIFLPLKFWPKGLT
jgi:hypothetical protein